MNYEADSVVANINNNENSIYANTQVGSQERELHRLKRNISVDNSVQEDEGELLQLREAAIENVLYDELAPLIATSVATAKFSRINAKRGIIFPS